MAGKLDLAAMKLAAIARRGIRRDFWDLFAIVQSGLSLRECARGYVEKYGVGEADLYHVLRSLTYFEDCPTSITNSHQRQLHFPIGLVRT
jgi:hypothetical protein